LFKTFTLQIDNLSQLKNDSGFWDNFIWPLAVAGVVGIFTLLYKACNFLYKKSSKNDDRSSGVELKTVAPCIEVKSFIELCQLLISFIDDNKYIFHTYGPNSSANETNELRTDMTLWHSARIDYIVPNNKIIKCLIEKNKHLISESHNPVFYKLTAHIYAFEKHVENPAFDYTEYQFPKEIEQLIKDECVRYVTDQDKDFLKIHDWININLKTGQVIEAYFFGSIMFSTKHNNDVDIVLMLNVVDINDILKFEGKKTKIKHSFMKTFKKPLHIEVFTNNEGARFREFLNRNKYKYKV
jgi:predicted nucleotidyltransferase